MTDSNMEEGNSENNCRLCLTDLNEENCSSIFTNTENNNGPSLPTKIMICLSLPIENDSKSSKICDDCKEEVTRFYDFREKVLRTHYSLSNSCNRSKTTEKPNNELDSQNDKEFIESRIKTENPNASFGEESNSSFGNYCGVPETTQVFIKEEPRSEHKCSHCNTSFSDAHTASLHTINCTQNPASETQTTENPENDPIAVDSSSTQTKTASSRSKPTEKLLECSECNNKYTTKATLKRHMLLHTGERPFACEMCDKRFSHISQLNFHRKFHINPQYRCEICEKPFLRPSDVEKHMRTHTGERPFGCKICKKRFTQASTLKGHEIIHTGIKAYVCEICGKRFAQKINKNKHLKVHKQGTKPHTCDLCGRTFSDYEEMMLHRGAHDGGKPRKCDHCDQCFGKKSDLDNHVRRFHTFERPHQCAFCPKAFFKLYTLKQHVMRHTGQKPYCCKQCDAKFIQKTGLIKHCKKVHKISEADVEIESVSLEENC